MKKRSAKDARREKRAIKRWRRTPRKRIPRRELARRIEAARAACRAQMTGPSSSTFGLAFAVTAILDGA